VLSFSIFLLLNKNILWKRFYYFLLFKNFAGEVIGEGHVDGQRPIVFFNFACYIKREPVMSGDK